jgi:hypothetical protein
MRALVVRAGILATLGLLGVAPGAGAVVAPPYLQCPAVGLDTGCQNLLVVSSSGQEFDTDPSQQPYEGAEDALVGIQNNTSSAIAAITLAGAGIFGFEQDGLCNSGTGPAPSGCALPPAVAADTGATACNPSTTQLNWCSFPPPANEPANYVEPGGFTNPGGPSGTDSVAWPNGDIQNGYEGPTSWFSNVSADTSTGTIHFDPPIPPGGSTYVSLETPPAGTGISAGAATTLSTLITATPVGGDHPTRPKLNVQPGTPVTDQATLKGSAAGSAGGSVTYAIYSDPNCSTQVGKSTTVNVTGGSIPAGPTVAPESVGTYYFMASYSGDANNQPAATNCGDETVTVQPATPLPPPVIGKTINFQPVSGTIFVELPGHAAHDAADAHAAGGFTKGAGYVTLTQPRQLPAGTKVDARAGTINLASATSGKKPQTITLGGGIFTNSQTKSGFNKGLTTISLLEGDFPGAPSYANCPKGAADAVGRAAKAKPKILQILKAKDKHGKFRTQTRGSSATVRGTQWETVDRCDGTLTIVQRGTVSVFDKGRRKTVTVHAHHSYLAKLLRH